MSTNAAPEPTDGRPRRSLPKFLMNTVIVCFFAVGTLVAAGSFGLFGCWCNEGFVRRDPPLENGPSAPLNPGEMPPLPVPAK
jgi:hypothetical protein